MIRILFQGDSITDGNRLKDPMARWDLNHQIGHSYVFNIAGDLGRRSPGKYRFINRGVSGDTVAKTAERWQTDTLDENPDILSVLLGINGNGENLSGKYPEGEDEHMRQFDLGYRSLLDAARAQNPDLKIILIEPFVLPAGKWKTQIYGFIPVFRRKQEIVRKIAEDYNAVFVPVQAELERLAAETAPVLKANGCDIDPYAYWLWDGVHPTEPMHSFLADLWLEAAGDILL